MEWYEKFKRILGVPERRESPTYNHQDRHWQPPSRDEESEAPFFQAPGRSFNMFTDPLEIHRYFEEQMSEMLRNFGFNEFADGFSNALPEIEDFTYPRIEEVPDDVPPADLRDKFLKPGYEKAKSPQDEKVDRDIDGRLDIKDWGSVLRGESQVVPKTQFYGKSVSVKTVRRPDGSIETHHTVRDNEGNEETTVTRKVDDKEYSITKRKDKDGKEETIENLVNLDEGEIEKFFPKETPKLPQPDQPWPLFDRFFK